MIFILIITAKFSYISSFTDLNEVYGFKTKE